MPTLDIVIPEEAGDVEECVVVTWLKREGDMIKKGDDLIILQAEKVSFEVPAPATGQLIEILAKQGEVVKQDEVLARIEVTDMETVTSLPPQQPALAAAAARSARDIRASPIAKRLAREHNIDLSQVVGSGNGGRITEKDVRVFIKTEQPKPANATPASQVRASPVAKRIAREHHLDLSQVPGSGDGGRIIEKDVQAFIAAQAAGGSPTQKIAEAPSPPPTGSIPMAGMRATIAQRMHQSLQSMAQLTLHTEADVTELVALREELKQQAPITYTDLIVRACALALRQHPHLNATLDEDTIQLLPHINIGVAVALDQGLVVPVIREADQRKVVDLAGIRVRLAERARAGNLTKEEISGGTFTITNLGNYDVDAFTPIINPPEAAILGVGRIVDKVVIHQGRIAQRAMLMLSLTFDHRVVDGAPAASFLQTIKQLLEKPARL